MHEGRRLGSCPQGSSGRHPRGFPGTRAGASHIRPWRPHWGTPLQRPWLLKPQRCPGRTQPSDWGSSLLGLKSPHRHKSASLAARRARLTVLGGPPLATRPVRAFGGLKLRSACAWKSDWVGRKLLTNHPACKGLKKQPPPTPAPAVRWQSVGQGSTLKLSKVRRGAELLATHPAEPDPSAPVSSCARRSATQGVGCRRSARCPG